MINQYVVLAPWVADIIYSYFIASSLNDESRRRARDITYFLYLLFLLVRVIHHQIWISLARFRTAKSKNRILDKPIEFEQVDRESNWYHWFLTTKYISKMLFILKCYLYSFSTRFCTKYFKIQGMRCNAYRAYWSHISTCMTLHPRI